MRRFHIWAEVRLSECEIEMPDTATDDECEEACAEALDNLIGNGDTGWNELDPAPPLGETEEGTT